MLPTSAGLTRDGYFGVAAAVVERAPSAPAGEARARGFLYAPAMRLSPLLLSACLAACGSSTTAPEPAPTGGPAEATPGPAATAEPSPSSIEVRSFTSPALGVAKDYVLYLPRGYASSPDRRYPVLYMLHGLGGSEVNWRDLGIGKAADDLGLEAIIVMPDGDDGFYVNWDRPPDYAACLASKRPFGKADDMTTYCVKQGRYEDYIVRDLRGHIEGSLRTLPGRENRAIGGLSMGGFGSLYLAMRHADLFGAVASHAGWVAPRYKGPDPYARGQVELVADPEAWLQEAGSFAPVMRQIFGASAERWRDHDPIHLAGSLEPGRLAIYFDCGTLDEFKFHNHNQYLAEILQARGIPHEFHLIEGGRHDGEFWRSRIDDSLRFVQAFFAGGK